MTKKINENFQNAIALLNQAERVFILGFGFHPINMNKLKLRETARGKIIATLGLGREENQGILEYFGDLSLTPSLHNISVYDLIRNTQF